MDEASGGHQFEVLLHVFSKNLERNDVHFDYTFNPGECLLESFEALSLGSEGGLFNF